MPTWNEICQVLDELRILILEVQIELADPATVPGSYFQIMARNSRIRPLTKS